EAIEVEKPIAPNRFSSVIGDLCDPLMNELTRHAPITPPACRVAPPRNNSAQRPQQSTPIYFAGVANLTTLQQACLLNQFDVLLMFRVEERKTRSGIDVKSVKFSVYDVWTNRQLLREHSINYLKRERDSASPLYKDPIRDIVRAFGTLLDDEFSPRPIPAGLRPEHAERRSKDLAQQRHPNPLALLAEIKLYRDADLITAQQMLSAVEQLMDSGQAIALLAGTPAERIDAIDRWIPRPQLTVARQGARGSDKPDRDP
ncbi:MAG: hypothetical protein KDA92_18700, partial [Planctomycetales bacterium]|nr:hypothetical protein [Planctomycetales bacterium]